MSRKHQAEPDTRQRKQAKAEHAPPTGGRKEPRLPPVGNPNLMYPAWQVALLELVDPFGWHTIGESDLRFVLEKLASFESMTWTDILVKGKFQNHPIPVADLCSEARRRLADLNQDDIDELVSLRLAGKPRIWGIRDGHLLKLLWWDPNHQVYPSTKKHT